MSEHPPLRTELAFTDFEKRRIVVSGTHSFLCGMQDGKFPYEETHEHRGGQFGLWAYPIKLFDGIYLALNSEPGKLEELREPQAIRVSPVTNTWRYLVASGTAVVEREDFCPDGERGFFMKLTITDTRPPDEAAGDRVMGWQCLARENLRPTFAAFGLNIYDGDDWCYRDDGMLWAKDMHHEWYCGISALPGADRLVWREGMFDGPELHKGHGQWGEMRWSVTVPAGGSVTTWVVAGGSSISKDDFMRRMDGLRSSDPQALLESKRERVGEVLSRSEIVIGDRDIERAFYWMKANLSMLDLHVPEDTWHYWGYGENEPGPVHGFAAGFPWYAHWFGCDGFYTALGGLAAGQHETATAHVRGIGKASEHINKNGRVLHEMTPSGQHFGWGNTQEAGHFVHCLRDVVRWTGNLDVARELYPYAKKALFEFLLKERCPDGDIFPHGPGITEVANLDGKVVDTACHTAIAAEALAEMAGWFGEPDVAEKASALYARIRDEVRERFWMEELGEFGDNIGTAGRWAEILPSVIRDEEVEFGISNTKPLEDLLEKVRQLPPEQEVTGQYGSMFCVSPVRWGLATKEQTQRQLEVFESERYSGPFGTYISWRIPTHAMTITTAEFIHAELAAGRPDKVVPSLHKMAFAFGLEMPGSATEMSPNYGCFMQAWTSYGIHHVIVAEMIGVHPNAPERTLTIRPQIPEVWKPVLGIRRLPVGGATFDIVHRYEDGIWSSEIVTDALGWEIRIQAPRSQSEVRACVNGKPHVGSETLTITT